MPSLSGNGLNNDIMTNSEKKIENKIEINGDSNFLKLVNGKSQDEVFSIINELVEAIKILHPRMFNSVIERISKI